MTTNNMKISGTFLTAGVVNGNGRIYTKEAMSDMMKQFQERDHAMYGMLGYPEDGVVSLSHVSHVVNSLKIKYKRIPRKKKKELKKNGTFETIKNKRCDLVGEIELLDTPSGKIAKKLMGGLVVRPMGTGTIREDGVIENYNLISCSLISKDDDSFKGII